MRNTIEQAVSERPVGQADVLPWINKEAIPLLRQMRAALNATYQQLFTAATAGTGTFTAIWTSDPLRTDSACDVFVRVVGRVLTGAANTCDYGRVASFRNQGGAVTQLGSTQSLWTLETAAACDVRLQVAGQSIEIAVRDDGASTYAWAAHLSILSIREV